MLTRRSLLAQGLAGAGLLVLSRRAFLLASVATAVAPLNHRHRHPRHMNLYVVIPDGSWENQGRSAGTSVPATSPDRVTVSQFGSIITPQDFDLDSVYFDLWIGTGSGPTITFTEPATLRAALYCNGDEVAATNLTNKAAETSGGITLWEMVGWAQAYFSVRMPRGADLSLQVSGGPPNGLGANAWSLGVVSNSLGASVQSKMMLQGKFHYPR